MFLLKDTRQTYLEIKQFPSPARGLVFNSLAHSSHLQVLLVIFRPLFGA